MVSVSPCHTLGRELGDLVHPFEPRLVMTSTALVQTEIRRFLRSEDPEVLCITGKWGVGKTYTWQAELDRARAARSVGLKRYSYVSLFGINSLEGLKLSIFENLEFLDAPPLSRFDQAVQTAKSVAAQAKKWSDLASTLPVIGGALTKAGPLYFSAVRNQIICIDDLERRGSGLSVKDVFGLISFLREQRGCKIVLLLNADALEGEGQAEFETYFERVVDARLVFVPTAADAIAIALQKNDKISSLLRHNCETLGISNIRVIKKIERLARQVEPLLNQFAPEITASALKSLALFGWSEFQPDEAPPIEYYRVSSFERYFAREDKKKQPSPQERDWDTLLTKYEFTHMDDLDKELLAFVDSGILDLDRINSTAATLNEQVSLQRSSGSYEQSWRPFHDSFDDNLGEVTKSIVDSLRTNIAVVSLSNFDTTVRIRKVG
jgi:hypothetical protein